MAKDRDPFLDRIASYQAEKDDAEARELARLAEASRPRRETRRALDALCSNSCDAPSTDLRRNTYLIDEREYARRVITLAQCWAAHPGKDAETNQHPINGNPRVVHDAGIGAGREAFQRALAGSSRRALATFLRSVWRELGPYSPEHSDRYLASEMGVHMFFVGLSDSYSVQFGWSPISVQREREAKAVGRSTTARRTAKEPVDPNPDYRPSRWFEERGFDVRRLRKAAAVGRRSKQVRTSGTGREVQYSAADVRRHWPGALREP